MHRFIIETGHVARDTVALSPDEALHAWRVLRLKVGDEVQLSDGHGLLFSAELTRVDQAGVEAVLLESCSDGEPPVQVTLYQGLPKFDKLELIAQKATELGVCRIVPVKMERSVVKLTREEGERKRERIQKICQEASKQCGRACVPEVLAPVSYLEALQMMSRENLGIMAWEEAKGQSLRDLRQWHSGASTIGLLIGPEGGITEMEARQADAAFVKAVTLGPRILRTETAAIATCALIMHLWGDI